MKYTNFDNCYNEVVEQYGKNAIREYIAQELKEMEFETLRQVTDQLYSAACAHGSWSGVIYNRDIDEKISDKAWRDAIEEALDDYQDNFGEPFAFQNFSQALWFAIEFEAQRFAMYLEHADNACTVVCAIDSLDPNPERIAFLNTSAAEDFLSDEVERRVDYIAQHATEVVTEEEWNSFYEIEASLVRLEMGA